MPRRLDLRGQRFGRLVVEELAGSDGNGALWRCRCDCGGVRVVSSSMLRAGRTKSCGCLLREIREGYARRHRETRWSDFLGAGGPVTMNEADAELLELARKVSDE